MAGPNNRHDGSSLNYTQPSKVVNALVGHRIRTLRVDRDLNLKQLAEPLGIPAKRLKEIELGNANISAELLYRVSASFSVNVGYFFQDLEALQKTSDGFDIDPYISRELPRLFKAYLGMENRDLKKSLVGLVESVAKSGTP